MWIREIIYFLCCCRSKTRTGSVNQRDGVPTNNNNDQSDGFELQQRLTDPNQELGTEADSAENGRPDETQKNLNSLQQGKNENEKDFYMDRWVRGKKFHNPEKDPEVWYEENEGRWFLRLEPVDVKEIRARHLIT